MMYGHVIDVAILRTGLSGQRNGRSGIASATGIYGVVQPDNRGIVMAKRDLERMSTRQLNEHLIWRIFPSMIDEVNNRKQLDLFKSGTECEDEFYAVITELNKRS
jgi:hypothetical protein